MSSLTTYYILVVYLLQMEEWLVENAKDLKLPAVKNEETIFEYLVNEQGEWEHWYNRVSRESAENLLITFCK